MLQIKIRQGTPDDAMLIADLIEKMVVEMEQHGGHTVNNSPAVWSSVVELVKANCACQENIYLIASQELSGSTIVGMAAAHIELLENIFVAKPRLHLSAIYTIPTARHQGVGRQLIKTLLEWGQRMTAVEANLNVLVANPARQFYEKLGFEPHEISMVKKLDTGPIKGM